jgi:hypothetical protein
MKINVIKLRPRTHFLFRFISAALGGWWFMQRLYGAAVGL